MEGKDGGIMKDEEYDDALLDTVDMQSLMIYFSSKRSND
jgi:hypothetical protein